MSGMGGQGGGGPGGAAAMDEFFAQFFTGGGPGGPGGQQERKKRESILNLALYVDKSIRVKFQGGREGECSALANMSGMWRDKVLEGSTSEVCCGGGKMTKWSGRY